MAQGTRWVEGICGVGGSRGIDGKIFNRANCQNRIDRDDNHILQRDHKQITLLSDNTLAWRSYVTRFQPPLRVHGFQLKEKLKSQKLFYMMIFQSIDEH